MKYSSQRGSALFVMIGYLAVITILASALLHLLHVHISANATAECKQVCMAIAEGGVEKALVSLKAAPGQYRGEQNTELGEGRFSVKVEQGKGVRNYKIISTGEIADGKLILASATTQIEVAFDESNKIRSMSWREVKNYEK